MDRAPSVASGKRSNEFGFAREKGGVIRLARRQRVYSVVRCSRTRLSSAVRYPLAQWTTACYRNRRTVAHGRGGGEPPVPSQCARHLRSGYVCARSPSEPQGCRRRRANPCGAAGAIALLSFKTTLEDEALRWGHGVIRVQYEFGYYRALVALPRPPLRDSGAVYGPHY